MLPITVISMSVDTCILFAICFSALHWLPVQYKIQYKVLLITYKALNNTTPGYITELINSKSTTRSLHSNNIYFMYPIVIQSHMVSVHSCKQCPYLIWNSIPLEFHSSSTVNTFKKAIKTHLFVKAF